MSRLIVDASAGRGYCIWEQTLGGTVGGKPQHRPPFPAYIQAGIAKSGVSGVTAVDEGNGFIHIYAPCPVATSSGAPAPAPAPIPPAAAPAHASVPTPEPVVRPSSSQRKDKPMFTSLPPGIARVHPQGTPVPRPVQETQPEEFSFTTSTPPTDTATPAPPLIGTPSSPDGHQYTMPPPSYNPSMIPMRPTMSMSPNPPPPSPLLGIGTIVSGIGGLLGSATEGTPCDFAKDAGAMYAKAHEKGWYAIALATNEGVLVYKEKADSQWKIPMCNLGADRLGFDKTYHGPITEQTFMQGGAGAGPGPSAGPGMDMSGGAPVTGTEHDLFSGMGFVPVRPRIIQVRRCPGPTRLTKSGWCVHKRILPAALRANKSKKAVISYSEGKHMREGFKAASRLKELNKRAASVARSLVPRRRRLNK